MRYLLVLLVVITASACAPKVWPPGGYNNLPDPRGKEITLGAGDVLSINVWDQKDLNTEGTIRPDGTITMPLIGDIKADGQTPTQLRDKIKAQLANFVKLGGGNEITVAVKAWRSYRFQVQGEVTKPGVFTNDEYVTVSGAIALAGGPTRFADRDSIVVLRKDPKTGETKHIPVSYDLIASGKRLDMDFWILSGDILFVP